MKLAVVSLLFGAAMVSDSWERTVGAGRHEAMGPASRAQMAARADGDHARMERGRDGHAQRAMREARRADPQVKLVALRCIDAQEPLGDEVALSVGGRRIYMGNGLVAGSAASLSALQPVDVEGFRVGLAELDGALFGVAFDDSMGEDAPSALELGSYTTTFRGNGGVYELVFRVEPGDDDRALAARDHAGTGRDAGGRGVAPPTSRDRFDDGRLGRADGRSDRRGTDTGGRAHDDERPIDGAR
jgi:hypothetical protein